MRPLVLEVFLTAIKKRFWIQFLAISVHKSRLTQVPRWQKEQLVAFMEGHVNVFLEEAKEL